MRRFLVLAVAGIALAATVAGVYFYRHRFVRQNNDLVRLLPTGDLNLIYADLQTLRRADLLGLLSNIKVAPDKEYDSFLAQTGFDYTRDLDAVAVGTDSSQTFILGRGRFQWDKLKAFALSHQGSCDADACRAPASVAGRWVNFISVQPDVLAVAISANQTAADGMRPPGRRLQDQVPNAPVWVRLSHTLLASPAGLPLPVQIFVISLQSADSVTLSAQTQSLHLKATFVNGATADTARRQLEIQTGKLRVALAEDHEKPDPAAFSGLLTAGSFQVVGSDVLGLWPIHPELLKALQ